MPDDDAPETEIEKVTRWRQETLLEAGYPQEEAFVLAGRHDVDLHRACDLLKKGCALRDAFKILL